MTGLITNLKVNKRPTRLWTCPSRKSNPPRVDSRSCTTSPSPNTETWVNQDIIRKYPCMGCRRKGDPLYTTHFALHRSELHGSQGCATMCLLFKIWCAHGWRYDVIHLASSFPSSGFCTNDIITITCL